jgi:hypothetical protein
MYLSIYSSRFEIFFGESKTAGDFSFIFPHQSVEAKKKTRTPPRHNAHKISGTLGVSVCKILLLCRANDLFLSIWYMYIAAVWNWNKIICNKYISSKRKRKEITFVFSLSGSVESVHKRPCCFWVYLRIYTKIEPNAKSKIPFTCGMQNHRRLTYTLIGSDFLSASFLFAFIHARSVRLMTPCPSRHLSSRDGLLCQHEYIQKAYKTLHIGTT